MGRGREMSDAERRCPKSDNRWKWYSISTSSSGDSGGTSSCKRLSSRIKKPSFHFSEISDAQTNFQPTNASHTEHKEFCTRYAPESINNTEGFSSDMLALRYYRSVFVYWTSFERCIRLGEECGFAFCTPIILQ